VIWPALVLTYAVNILFAPHWGKLPAPMMQRESEASADMAFQYQMNPILLYPCRRKF
jgi:hypothetical protein